MKFPRENAIYFFEKYIYIQNMEYISSMKSRIKNALFLEYILLKVKY